MLISTVFQHQSVTTLSKHATQHYWGLDYHTQSPDFAVTFFSHCIVSILLSAKNLLADSIIQTTFCLPRFSGKIDVVNSESCRPNLPQNIDFVQPENIPTKFISGFKLIVKSREVREISEKGSVIILEVHSVVLQKSAVEISEVHTRNFRSAHWYFILEWRSNKWKMSINWYQRSVDSWELHTDPREVRTDNNIWEVRPGLRSAYWYSRRMQWCIARTHYKC